MSEPYSFYIEKLNASYAQIHTEEACILEDLYQWGKVKDPSYDKNNFAHRKWDGYQRLITRTGRMPIGILGNVCKFARKSKYHFELDSLLSKFRNITEKDIDEYIDYLNLSRNDEHGEPVDCLPWEYQSRGLRVGLNMKRALLLADTGAGKSLMVYMFVRYYLDEMSVEGDDGKILVIVPSINLVGQLHKDFNEYSQFNNWNVDTHCHKISSVDGGHKNSHKQVFITTWQSIQDMPGEYFQQFSKVICDEVHGARSNKIQYIINSCTNANDRIGLTGTLYEAQLHQIQVVALFGPKYVVATTADLKRLGQVSETEIQMFNLNYSDREKLWMRKLDFNSEIDTIIHHPYRNKMITLLCQTLPGNTLVLFERKEHIKIIYEMLIKVKPPGTVFIINGDVVNEHRDEIKALTEEGTDITILATYGTMAVGVSIKKLHNGIFCHSSKSIVRVLQSAGRLFRRHFTKKKALLIDLCDNFKLASGEPNHTMAHAMKRYNFYTSKGHEVKFKKYDMKDSLEDDFYKDQLEATKRREKARKLKAERMKLMNGID